MKCGNRRLWQFIYNTRGVIKYKVKKKNVEERRRPDRRENGPRWEGKRINNREKCATEVVKIMFRMVSTLT